MSKKVISMLLVLSLCLSLSAVAFAADVQEEGFTSSNVEDYLLYDDSYWKTIEVTLDDGSIVQVDVPRNQEMQIENIFGGGASTMDFTPSVPVGTKRSYSVRIKNDQLSATGNIISAGTAIGAATKMQIAKIGAAAINVQAAAAIVVASQILNIIGQVNILCGNTGFILTANFEYTSRYINKDDYYLYNWSFKGASIRAY